mgnify:CR=1 FL=1
MTGGKRWDSRSGRKIRCSIWICLTFLTPVIALGPMFYIVFQNLYNSYLLARNPKLEQV